ncbi:MAG: hypothetical protein L0216_21600 [Planctomycetales bacterium]|nr:hypothetical protein [Planctomycetales bacterium]
MLLIALLDGIAALYAASQVAGAGYLLAFPGAPDRWAPMTRDRGLLWGALTAMLLTSGTLAAATTLLLASLLGTRERIRLGLLVGACGVAGPAVMILGMFRYRSLLFPASPGTFWPIVLLNGAGTAVLLVVNGLPASLWWHRWRAAGSG